MSSRAEPDLSAATQKIPQRPLAYTVRRFAELIQGADGERISERTVRSWCERKLLPGARKIGGRWIIPASAIDPDADLPENVSLFRRPQS